MAGKYKGRAIETQQRRLSAWLTRHVGQPEKFKGGQSAERAIGERRGIVSFFSIYGDAQPQGHIAIVSKDRWGKYLRCGNEIDGTATGCYWSSREVWFWPLAWGTERKLWRTIVELAAKKKRQKYLTSIESTVHEF